MSENIHDFNMRVRSEQSRESKQREAEYASNSADAHTRLTHMQLERDAALNALEIARTALVIARKRLWHYPQCRHDDTDEIPCNCGYVSVDESLRQALCSTFDPTAAERDRAIREECAAWLSRLPLPRLASDYRREFNLEPKPKGK